MVLFHSGCLYSWYILKLVYRYQKNDDQTLLLGFLRQLVILLNSLHLYINNPSLCWFLLLLFLKTLSICSISWWCSGKESDCQCRRHKTCSFDPWVVKIPWGRKQQVPLVFLPGKSHGQRSLVAYSLDGGRESDMTEHKNVLLFLIISSVCSTSYFILLKIRSHLINNKLRKYIYIICHP